MRTGIKQVSLVVVVAALATGCASAERKLGRGLNNFSEPLRMGELQRSFEQAYLWDGPDTAYGEGALHGIHRTIGRAAVGLFEILTFPIPSDPYFKPV